LEKSNIFYRDELIKFVLIILIKTDFDWKYFPIYISPYFDSDILYNENNFDSSTHDDNDELDFEGLTSCKAIQLNKLINFEELFPISDDA